MTTSTIDDHIQAVWLDAGYTTHPNLTAARVIFTGRDC
jgi:hypothetical protein